ncbi:YidC/Oxa1 family insertase periplasmic-domain containing protein, partial [Rhizobium ruizarguesonis]
NNPPTPTVYVLHEGINGVNADHGLNETKYIAAEKEAVKPAKSTGGWLGITDKNWAATIFPTQSAAYEARFSHFDDGQPRY